MEAKYPKKPKLLKYRRKPKPTASLSVLENWLKHVKDTDASNKQKINDWKKKKSEIDRDHKRHGQLAKAVAGIGAVDYRNIWMKKHSSPKRKSASVGSVGKKRKKSAPKKAAKKSARRKTRR